jgi:uncharacterized SAM-binding protein YcdF (DUF218 family)
MKNTFLKILTAAGVVVFLAYYVALKLYEPNGRTLSFSLVVPAIALILVAFLFAGDRIVSRMRAAFSKNAIIKYLTISIVAIFLGISTGFLWYITVPYQKTNTSKTEYLIVLGGGIRKTGEPTNGVRARLDTAAKYIAANPDITVIVSGGKGKETPWPEAVTMAGYLNGQKGLKRAIIIQEGKSIDTIQNLEYSKKLIEARERSVHPGRNLLNDPPMVTVLTSGYHLKRALYLARLVGYTNTNGLAAPCPPLTAPISYLREVGAWWKLSIRIAFTDY